MPISENHQDAIKNASFIVRNITSDRKKIIKIFNYPILYDTTRDLLAIPGVTEADIRASLLKGEIKHKILVKDIVVEYSDIDLLQFNNDQKQFLQNSGVTIGLEVTGIIGNISYLLREEIPLIGIKNGTNRLFYTPEKFLNGILPSGDNVHIKVYHNGKSLYEGIDYTIAESGGPGTGYDTINIFSFSPISESVLYASYCIKS